MLISERWLRELVPGAPDLNTLIERLTLAGLEVAGAEPAAPPLESVVVAEVLDAAPHPNADRLRLCQVSDGTETLPVVCGAPNVRAGLKVALAQVGARLPGDLRIRKSKIRGEVSQGMLCSGRELGLDDDQAGILELPADAPSGVALSDYLELDDHLIEVDLTPNRGDCLSALGLARELAALLDLPLAWQAPGPVAAEHEQCAEVEIRAPADCPRYAARILLEVDAAAPTPGWLRERLRRSGIRSLGAVVDITNYVLLETGQPLHAFDLDRLHGGIRVRRAAAGELLTLLGEQSVTLGPEHLVIADANGPVALAGIMGGAGSAVSSETRRVLLESAYFPPAAVAGRARGLGLGTDAAHRFERGVDPTGQVRAIERATALLVEICGARPGPVTDVRDAAHQPAPAELSLRRSRCRRVLGIDLELEQIGSLLQRLGMSTRETDADTLAVTAPSFRFDLTHEVDLIEEVARLHGYDRIPAVQPPGSSAMLPAPDARLEPMRLRSLMVDRGYREVVTYSFVGEVEQRRLFPQTQAPVLQNPLSADQAVMRVSLWPGLLQTAVHNRNRQVGRMRLFELGRCFRIENSNYIQPSVMSGIICSDSFSAHCLDSARASDLYDLKADIDALLAMTGSPTHFTVEPASHPALHPGQAARLLRDGRTVGWFGRLHPSLEQELELPWSGLFELDLEVLTEQVAHRPRVVSPYPLVERDLSLLVPRDTLWAQLRTAAQDAAGATLVDIDIFDLYTGAGIGAEHKSVGLRLRFSDPERNLTDAEIEQLQNQVLEALTDRFGAQLRA